MASPNWCYAHPSGVGKKHAKQAALDVERRLRLFKEGAFLQLHSEAELLYGERHRKKRQQVPRILPDPQEGMDDHLTRSIRGLVEEGAYAKAAQRLVSRGLCDTNCPLVAATLTRLHPVGEAVALGADPELPSTMECDCELSDDEWPLAVRKAAVAFPPGSAPGPSGLRPMHLKECLERINSGSALLAGLTSFAQAAISGSLHPRIAPLLCASTLVPLQKKDGGVRPIAVGDTLRRVVGKLLLSTSQAREEIKSLQPRQVGVGTPFAAELVGMAMQRIADSRPNGSWVALQVDVSNAFNCISRPAMLRQCAKKAPSLYNWLAWCYNQPCELLCDGRTVATSRIGVHQGDAMGPVGFALGLDQALDAISDAANPLEWGCWYLDDGILVGKPADVALYLETLKPALAEVGLSLNVGKCSS